jgi:hypothetical protein
VSDAPNYDFVIAAVQSKSAFRVVRFKADDLGREDLYIMAGKKRIERVPCIWCEDLPKVEYTSGMEINAMGSVKLVCGCGRWVSLTIESFLFERARGAMASACGSLWNCLQDEEEHPDDIGKAGGMILNADELDKEINRRKAIERRKFIDLVLAEADRIEANPMDGLPHILASIPLEKRIHTIRQQIDDYRQSRLEMVRRMRAHPDDIIQF